MSLCRKALILTALISVFGCNYKDVNSVDGSGDGNGEMMFVMGHSRLDADVLE